MEDQLSNNEKEAFKAKMSRAERSESPMASTYKMIAVLRALDTQIPVGVAIDGDKIRQYVAALEARGLTVPGVPLSKLDATEIRAFRSDFAVKSFGVALPFGKGATTTTSVKPSAVKHELTDAELRAKINRQIEQFEQMCNDADPLLKIAKKRNADSRQVMKGKLCAEDQALVDEFERIKRG